jgi:hypothetical protein
MLSDFQSLVAKAVRDDSGLITAVDIDAAIALAVSRYSLDRPQYAVEDLEPTGLGELLLPETWEQGFSNIVSLEYPIGDFPARIVDPEAYAVYQRPVDAVLRLLFAPTDAVRATFSKAHVLSRETGLAQTDGTTSTIVLSAAASVVNDFYTGLTVVIDDGMGIGQSGLITGYDGLTQTATIATAWAVAPDATSHYYIDIMDTIPANNREALTCWAAAYCLDQLAAFAAGVTESTIQAGQVQRGSQTRDYAARANALRTRYILELGIDEKRSVAAGVVVNLDLKNSRGQDRFTHPNRFR